MLQWIVPTRPDMAFATKERARALASPTNADMIALRHLVRYYRTTSDLELRIQSKTRTRVPEVEPELLSVEAYSDSDWAGCRDTRRSTSGGMIYFEGAVLTFWSRTQTTIALSSCEAELYAINMATIEALNVKSTIEELIKKIAKRISQCTPILLLQNRSPHEEELHGKQNILNCDSCLYKNWWPMEHCK